MAKELTKEQREKLMNKRFFLILKLQEQLEHENEVVNSLGWGYSMRAYSKTKQMNLSKSDEIREQIKAIEQDLGWC